MKRLRFACSIALSCLLAAPSLAVAAPPLPPLPPSPPSAPPSPPSPPSAPPSPSAPTPKPQPESPAQAAQKAPASDDEKAARWMSTGNKAFREGKFAEAEKAYREAFALKSGYDIAGNLGAAELAQGKSREAAGHLAFTLRNFPVTGEPALREQMQKAFDQARKGIAALRVKVDVAGAAVMVDGVRAGEAPLPDDVFVDPGEHDVDAAREGFTSVPRHVTAQKDATVEVTITLTPVRNPLEQREVPPEPKRGLVPGIVIGGVAALGLAGGGVFLGLAASRKSDAEAARDAILGGHGTCVSGAGNYDTKRCTGLTDSVQKYVTYHNTAVGAFVVGSLAAAGAAAYFFWPARWSPWSRTGFSVTPVVGAEGGALVGSGSF